MLRKKELLLNLTSSLLLLKLASLSVALGGVAAKQERLLPAGSYMPFYASNSAAGKPKADAPRKPIDVSSFWLDTYPVTNREYLSFVKAKPEWRRSRIASVFADNAYLKHWRTDLALRAFADNEQPVTHVSWFAASAYCHAQGKELPTTDQWEYAAEDAGKNAEKIKAQILEWYSAPNAKILSRVKKQPANSYGIYDLHGLIWEWSLDFNSTIIGLEPRSDGTKDENLFCGSGSLNALNPADYAKFMRYSFRNSLQANYTTANLGFRCAREEKK